MKPSTSVESGGTTILQRQFHDIDQFVEQAQTFCKVQMTQLSPGYLQCHLYLVAFDEIQIAFVNSSCPIFINGEKPKDSIVFSCLLETVESCLISHHRKVPHHTLAGCDPHSEISTVLPSNVQYVAVQINRQALQTSLAVMAREDLDDRYWSSHNYVHLPETFPALKSYLQQLYHLMRQQPAFLQQPHFKTLLLEDFMPLLINAIPPVTQAPLKSLPPLARAELVKQAEDYMMAHLDQPLTLQTICQALHVSERPLFYGFQEIYGVSPMGYLKVQRLQSVRRSLKLADPKTTSVTDIARRFGFWSGGHFSRDYKKMYGELPSETLRRASQAVMSH